ncbi:MAG: hypothetical protein ACJ71Y_14940, partial [Blastococcus sp.]
PTDDGSPWALSVNAPDSEDQLPAALDVVAKGVAAGTALVAVGGGSALARRLLCEAARLEHDAVSLLIEEVDPARAEDVAGTAVLSGRTDLVSAPVEKVAS